VLLPFSREAGFGTTKPGGTPCHHLTAADRCEIHATLRADGWPGCTVYECFGAGQQVSQVTYAGTSWREQPDLGEMAAALSVMQVLHEFLLHLTEAERRAPGSTGDLVEQVAELTGLAPEPLLGLDVDRLHDEVGGVLAAVSLAVRDRWPGAADLGRADLSGRDLRDRDLRGAALRGSTLIRADLRDADLADADLLGADVRDADVRGARLADALFLTQRQVNAMRGDARTTVSDRLVRPPHWE